MPANTADIAAVTSFLAKPKLKHLHCRKRGDTVVLESGPARDPVPHLRLRKLSSTTWGVEAPTHTGRWEPIRLQGPLREVLGTAAESFPWLLAPID